MLNPLRRRAFVALAAATTATAISAAPAAAAPDRTGSLSATESIFKWSADSTTALGGLLTYDDTDPGASCGKTFVDYCDQTLLKLASPGVLTVELPDGGDGVSADFDLYLYSSNDTGTPGKKVGESINSGGPEKIAVQEAEGNYVAVISYYLVLGSGTDGQAKFEPSGAAPAPGAPAANALPTSVIGKVAKSASAKKLKKFSGTAADDGGVKKVQISLTRIEKGRCTSMTSNGSFKSTPSKNGKCVPTTFVKAKGTSNWSYKLKKKLKKGSYTLFSRATDTTGQVEAGFNAKNSRSFKVK